jgi:hypothetical protein
MLLCFPEHSAKALISFQNPQIFNTISTGKIQKQQSHYHLIIRPTLLTLPSSHMLTDHTTKVGHMR